MQLIYEINAYILAELRSRPQVEDPFLSRSISLIDESYGPVASAWAISFFWVPARSTGSRPCMAS